MGFERSKKVRMSLRAWCCIGIATYSIAHPSGLLPTLEKFGKTCQLLLGPEDLHLVQTSQDTDGMQITARWAVVISAQRTFQVVLMTFQRFTPSPAPLRASCLSLRRTRQLAKATTSSPLSLKYLCCCGSSRQLATMQLTVWRSSLQCVPCQVVQHPSQCPGHT